MIKFDPNKLTFEYVYIRKIFKSFIEVVTDKNREVYDSSTVDFKRLKDKSVQIPIHYRVFSLYLKTNSLLHFDVELGKKACIFYYDGKVLSIDVYRKSFFSNDENESTWISVNEGVFSHIKEMLKVHEDIYIDGESIFLIDKMLPVKNFKTNKNFWIQPVRYLSLSKMGIKKNISKLLENKTTEKAPDNESIIILKNGYVLAYNPYADDTTSSENPIVVYSPVFSNTQQDSKRKKKDGTDEYAFIKNLENIENTDDPTVLNLNYVLKATKIIGDHYSFEDTDFLDVPSLILETKIINLKSDITLHSRSTYPVKINVWDGLAYLMRYCYKETNLNIYRDLVSLFKFTLVKGFVSKKQTGDLFLDGKSMSDIKRHHYKIKQNESKEIELNVV